MNNTAPAIKPGIRITPSGKNGHDGASPVRVAENEHAAIEVGAYQTSGTGFGFTVVLVEKVTSRRQLQADRFHLAAEYESSADKAAKPAIHVVTADGWATTIDAHTPREQRQSTLNIDLPFGNKGIGYSVSTGGVRQRLNGDRVIQHGVLVCDLPSAVEEIRQQEARIERLSRSDPDAGARLAADLAVASAVVGIGVQWGEMDLAATVNVDVCWQPDSAVAMRGRQLPVLSL